MTILAWNDEFVIVIGKNVEGSGHDLFRARTQHLPGGTEKNHDNLRITDLRANLSTSHRKW
jgi:hypothetical protein